MAALLSFGLIGSAAAHSIWVEREGDGARIYFGEFDENLREGSPGLLDRLKPEAKVAGSDKALKLDKQATFFAVAGPLAKDDSIVAENVAITERRGDKPTKVLNRLGARTVADFKELPAVNTLDIVPAGKPGLFKVFYQGKPLAKAKAELIAELGWKREFKTDEQGLVRSDPAVARRLRDRGPAHRCHAGQAGRGGLRFGALRQHALRARRRRPAGPAAARGDDTQALRRTIVIDQHWSSC